MKIAVF